MTIAFIGEGVVVGQKSSKFTAETAWPDLGTFIFPIVLHPSSP